MCKLSMVGGILQCVLVYICLFIHHSSFGYYFFLWYVFTRKYIFIATFIFHTRRLNSFLSDVEGRVKCKAFEHTLSSCHIYMSKHLSCLAWCMHEFPIRGTKMNLGKSSITETYWYQLLYYNHRRRVTKLWWSRVSNLNAVLMSFVQNKW